MHDTDTRCVDPFEATLNRLKLDQAVAYRRLWPRAAMIARARGATVAKQWLFGRLTSGREYDFRWQAQRRLDRDPAFRRLGYSEARRVSDRIDRAATAVERRLEDRLEVVIARAAARGRSHRRHADNGEDLGVAINTRRMSATGLRKAVAEHQQAAQVAADQTPRPRARSPRRASRGQTSRRPRRSSPDDPAHPAGTGVVR